MVTGKRTREQWEPEVMKSNVKGIQGDVLVRVTGVRSDMVMASCIDGPSHKWAVQSVSSHDLKII